MATETKAMNVTVGELNVHTYADLGGFCHDVTGPNMKRRYFSPNAKAAKGSHDAFIAEARKAEAGERSIFGQGART